LIDTNTSLGAPSVQCGGGPDLASYDVIVVAFSGGKDSLACLLHLLELGVPRSRIELWHYDVDGREGSRLFDWPCTRAYCRAIAKAFGVPIFFGWKVGGIEGEMLRDNAPTKPTRFETPEGVVREIGGKGPLDTRLKYPQVAGSLTARWCSAYVKIDVCSKMLCNQRRFFGRRTLIVGGERAEESPNRAKYESFEPDRTDPRKKKKRKAARARKNSQPRPQRHVDRWLAVHAWSERDVWAIIERHRVNPHPCYRLGWGRCSCRNCIFANANQRASERAVDPVGFQAHADLEVRFGRTVHRKLSVIQLADKGTPYEMREEDVRAAMSEAFEEPIFLDRWTLPAGAFGDGCGPS